MPAAEMMTFGFVSKLISLDSALVMESFSPRKRDRVDPLRHKRLRLLVITVHQIILKHTGRLNGKRTVDIDLESVVHAAYAPL